MASTSSQSFIVCKTTFAFAIRRTLLTGQHSTAKGGNCGWKEKSQYDNFKIGHFEKIPACLGINGLEEKKIRKLSKKQHWSNDYCHGNTATAYIFRICPFYNSNNALLKALYCSPPAESLSLNIRDVFSDSDNKKWFTLKDYKLYVHLESATKRIEASSSRHPNHQKAEVMVQEPCFAKIIVHITIMGSSPKQDQDLAVLSILQT